MRIGLWAMADGESRSAVLQTISQPGARGAATTDDQGRAREGAANSAGGTGQPAQAGARDNKIRCQQKTNLPVWVKISHFALSKILQSDRLTLFRWSRPQPRRPRAGGGRGEADAAWAGVATRAACGARAPRRTRGGALEGKPGQGPGGGQRPRHDEGGTGARATHTARRGSDDE